jgi:hypothetical protein
MANDKPTSLRMGFGYGQARAAGLGGVRADRSPRQVNKITKENQNTRRATTDLRRLAEDPEWIPLIKFLAGEGATAEEISEEIYWVNRYAWARIKKRFSLEYCLNYHWPR